MEKILYECLTDLTPNAEANCIHSKSKELASFLYENMTNLFHDLNNNKHLIRYSQKAMQMYIGLYTSSSGAFKDVQSSSLFPVPSKVTMKSYIGSTSNLEENDSVLYDQLEEGSVIQLLFD